MSLDVSSIVEKLFGDRSSAVTRDLKLNFQKLMSDSSLTPEEAILGLLACSAAVDEKELSNFASTQAQTLGFSHEQILEAKESAAIMAMLNIYYRAKHMLKTGNAENVEANYKATGLRMTALAKPVLGKEKFEMLALAVSVINGCETCINAHEESCREAGVDPQKLHDLIRLAAVVKAIKTLMTI